MLAIVITFLIGRYTIKESRRIEQYNKFIKNLNRYEEKKAGKQKSKV